MKRKGLLRVWIHKIGHKNLPLNNNSRVCSDHFVNSSNRRLQKDEYPTLQLPKLPMPITMPQKRRILQRHAVESVEGSHVETEDSLEDTLVKDVSTNTDITYQDLVADLESLQKKVTILKEHIHLSRFSLESMASDDGKISFYTGFPHYATLEACYGTYQLQLKRDTRGTRRATRVAHACFCLINAITHTINYLRV